MENGDEIYSLCQVPPVVKLAATTTITATANRDQVLPPPPPVPAVVTKRSSTEKLFKPKCLVDSTTFLLPAGDGPVYLDAKETAIPVNAATKKTAVTTALKKKQVCTSDSPKAATAKIFAPRTEDMNKGFLTFSDDDTGLTSKLLFVFLFYPCLVQLILYFMYG